MSQRATATATHDYFPVSEAAICFTKGTRILTPRGEVPIERLSAGQEVLTLDHGPQPIRWIGHRTVRATGALAPVQFLAGAIGNHRDLLVSPQHRMLQGRRARTGLAPAIKLVDHDLVHVAFGGMVTYMHLIFDQHEVIFAEGAASESFHPSMDTLETLTPPAREELFDLFPRLRSDPNGYGPKVRPDIAA